MTKLPPSPQRKLGSLRPQARFGAQPTEGRLLARRWRLDKVDVEPKVPLLKKTTSEMAEQKPQKPQKSPPQRGGGTAEP
jgi:hypothetical protein